MSTGTLRKEAGRLVAEPAFEVTHEADVAVVKLLGEHDLAGQSDLADRLRKPVLSGERLIVDLSEAEFIDSSVLNNLLAVERLAHKRRLDIVLQLTTSSAVAQLLEISGLDRHFRSARSRQEAVRLVRAPDGNAD